jgi:hypothetical protein
MGLIRYGPGGKIKSTLQVETKDGKVKVTSSKDIEKKENKKCKVGVKHE